MGYRDTLGSALFCFLAKKFDDSPWQFSRAVALVATHFTSASSDWFGRVRGGATVVCRSKKTGRRKHFDSICVVTLPAASGRCVICEKNELYGLRFVHLLSAGSSQCPFDRYAADNCSNLDFLRLYLNITAVRLDLYCVSHWTKKKTH